VDALTPTLSQREREPDGSPRCLSPWERPAERSEDG
jgi:hypothetical protein